MENKSPQFYPTEQENKIPESGKDTRLSLSRRFNFKHGFNSLKVVTVCFLGILVVSCCESYNKISTHRANSLNTLLFLISGGSVVLEQYLDLTEARERRKRNLKN